MNKNLLEAIDSSQRAQRNYDLSRSISQKDLDTLIYASSKSPSKQNEKHYSLFVYTDPIMIRKIYDTTKKFTLFDKNDNLEKLFGEKNEVYWQNDDYSVKNSQVLANVLFVYTEEKGEPRGGTHIVGQQSIAGKSAQLYKEQIDYSIGISVGQLILSANLLGLKTGICSAMDGRAIKKVVGTEKSVKMLVGVGFENADTDRRLHPDVLNRDVSAKFRNGKDSENWRFPSFEKECKVYLNGQIYS
jgi:nitroreductase